MAGNNEQPDNYINIENSKNIQIGDRYFWNQVNNIMRNINEQRPPPGQSSNDQDSEEEVLISLPEELINSERPAEVDDFYAISDQIASNWKKLARFLPPKNTFSVEELNKLEKDNKDQLEEAIIQMLQLWREKTPNLATVGNLAITLQSIGKAKVAKLLQP